MKSLHVFAVAAASALALGACTIPEQAPTTDSSPGSATDSSPVYTVTSVKLNADGTSEVQYSQVTEAQQLAEHAARAAAKTARADGLGTATDAIAQNASCPYGTSMWNFDNSNYTGNEICFGGAGTVALSSYCRQYHYVNGIVLCYTTWNAAVRSYEVGSEYGNFTVSDNHENFTAYEVSTAGYLAQESNSLTLSD